MLHTLRGGGFSCLLTLISIKMEHLPPPSLQVCTIVCVIYKAHRGRGVLGLGGKIVDIKILNKAGSKVENSKLTLYVIRKIVLQIKKLI